MRDKKAWYPSKLDMMRIGERRGRKFVPSPEYIKDSSLRSAYGITLETYNRAVELQGGRCAICDELPKNKPLNVDHNHETNELRGLLCSPCNHLLGHARDNVSILKRAIEYLENPPGILEFVGYSGSPEPRTVIENPDIREYLDKDDGIIEELIDRQGK